MNKTYLDNAATTPLRPEVILRMSETLQDHFGNPSSTHSFGRASRSVVEHARKRIALSLNAQPSEIIFTSGGTEADNMILRAAVRDLGVKTIITAKTEHHAVLHTAEQLHREYGTEVRFVILDEYGVPSLEHLESLMSGNKGKQLLSLMHVNNEIGNLLDIAAVGQLCRQYDVLFHSDTVQSIGHFIWDTEKAPVDFLTASAHKFHGPKGVGFAYIKTNSGLGPLIFGGQQERGYRAGTESVHNIAGLETALSMATENIEVEKEYVLKLKTYFLKHLPTAMPGVAFNGHSGDPERSTYTIVNARLPLDEKMSEMLLFNMDLKGIACSRGSACQSGSVKASHVLEAILHGKALRQPSLRFSFSIYNTIEELDYVLQVLSDITKKAV